jgi:hypothetical protein
VSGHAQRVSRARDALDARSATQAADQPACAAACQSALRALAVVLSSATSSPAGSKRAQSVLHEAVVRACDWRSAIGLSGDHADVPAPAAAAALTAAALGLSVLLSARRRRTAVRDVHVASNFVRDCASRRPCDLLLLWSVSAALAHRTRSRSARRWRLLVLQQMTH